MPDYKKSSYEPSDKEKERIKEVGERKEKMKRGREDQEKDWDEADKQYQMHRDERPQDEWRADLKLPDTFSVVEAALSEMASQSPGITYRPRESGDAKKARKHNKIFKYTWGKGNGDIELIKFMKDALIYGTAIGEEYWRQDVVTRKSIEEFDLEEFRPEEWEERERTEFDDVYFKSIPIWNFYVDPMATSLDAARDCAKVLVMPREDFKRKYEKYSNSEKVAAGASVYRPRWFEPMGNMDDYEIEVVHYYNRAKDLYLVLANDVLLTPPNNPIPYKHKKLPFVRAVDIMLPHSFYGMGEPKLMKCLQDERDTIRNMRLDTTHLNIQKQYIVDDRLELDDQDLIARPHGIIKGPIDSVSVVPQRPIHPEAYREEELINNDIIKATGIDLRMQSLGGKRDTATEVAILKESALKRIRLKLRIMEKTALHRIGRLRLANVQQFYSIPKVKKILGEGGEIEEKKTYRNIGFATPSGAYAWFTARPEDITGEYDVVVVPGATLPVSKALEAQKRINLFDRLAGHPNVNQEELARMVIRAHDEDPQKLLKKPRTAGPMPTGEMPEAMPPVGVGRTPAKRERIRPEEALPGRAMAGGPPE